MNDNWTKRPPDSATEPILSQPDVVEVHDEAYQRHLALFDAVELARL